jgi:hypothetical protein
MEQLYRKLDNVLQLVLLKHFRRTLPQVNTDEFEVRSVLMILLQIREYVLLMLHPQGLVVSHLLLHRDQLTVDTAQTHSPVQIDKVSHDLSSALLCQQLSLGLFTVQLIELKIL